MFKPYVSKISASACVLGTALWFDAWHGNGMPCRTFHPQVPGTPLEYPPDPNVPCNNAGWIEIVYSYRQLWVYRKCRGTWVNGKLYMPGSQLQVVVGASLRSS